MIQRFLFLLLSLGISSLSHAGKDYWEYTFRPGDSIWKIAKKYTSSADNWYEINKLNQVNLGKGKAMRPGMKILIPVSMLKQQPAPAIVIAISGDVQLTRSNEEVQTGFTGVSIYSGDNLTTGSDQRVRIQFDDGSILQIAPQSSVTLEQLTRNKLTGTLVSKVRVHSGTIDAEVEGQVHGHEFEVLTESATAKVKGTAFGVTAEEGATRITVREGVVDVSAGGTQHAVQAGYGVSVEAGIPLTSPGPLLAEPGIRAHVHSATGNVDLNWERLRGAHSYRYQLATDEHFDNIIKEGLTTQNSRTIQSLDVGYYYLRINGVDRHGLQGRTAFTAVEVPRDEGLPWEVVALMVLMLIAL